MDTDNKKNMDDQNSNQNTDNTPIVDDRTELDKRLEKIESIEAHNITKSQDQSSQRHGQESTVEAGNGESAGNTAVATSNGLPGATLGEEQEDPAILAARNSLRRAERSKVSKQKGRRKYTGIFIALLVVLLLAVGVAAAWLYFQKKDTDSQLSATQSSLTGTKQELAALQRQKQTALPQIEEESTPAQETDALTDVQQYREIPEWGVRYKLTSDNKALTYGIYSLQPNFESIGFASLDIARKAGVNSDTQQLSCGIGSAGLVQRLNEAGLKEMFPAEAQLAQAVHKKVGEYHYVYRTPQSPCSSMNVEEKAAAAAASAIIETLETTKQD